MTIQSVIDLPKDYEAVLRRVRDNGEEDLASLPGKIDINHSRLSHIIKSLKKKGLIVVSPSTYDGAWVRLSTKGRKLMNYVNPDGKLRQYA